jgi:tRNA (guanine-N7-)-methyltransferase
MTTGGVEYELGVPIPGHIRPQAEWAKTAIKRLPEPGPLDWSTVFGRTAPIVLDVGCGNGRYTLQSALARPEFDHFAIDLLPVVIRYATRRANQRGLHNVRFAVKDGETFLKNYVPKSSISEIHLYHPQPYHDHDKSHLRLLTPHFLALVHAALIPGGLVVAQTDNRDYWAYMKSVLAAFFHFAEHPDPWPDAPQGRTRREIVARQRGLAIYRGLGRRRDDLTPADLEALLASLPPPTFRSRVG